MCYTPLLSCPKCKNAEQLSVRLQPCPKVPSRKILRLLCQRQSGDRIVGKYHMHSVTRYMQHSNILVVKCNKCQWWSKIQGQSREQHLQLKSQLVTAGTGLTATDSDTSLPEVPVHPEGTDRRRRRKLKKKERKRAAKAKRDQAINLGLQERGSFSTTPASLSSATPPSTSSGSGSNQTASPAAVPVPLPTSSRSKALSMNAPPPQVTRKDSKLQTLSRAHVGGKRKSGLSRHVMQMLQKDKKKAGSSKGSLAQFLENLQ